MHQAIAKSIIRDAALQQMSLYAAQLLPEERMVIAERIAEEASGRINAGPYLVVSKKRFDQLEALERLALMPEQEA